MTAAALEPRTFLLTGVTGFLGKVLLEELVRRQSDLGIEQIGVVIRPMRGLRAEERFRREVVRSECFSRLPANWTQAVTVIDGNLEDPEFGAESAAFLERVTHVVHAAASVKFDVPAEAAARVNVMASVRLMELVKTLPRVARFVYVSTAYVTPHPGNGVPIDETLAPLAASATDVYAACLGGSSDDESLLNSTHHPNSYTLSKSVAEHLLIEHRGDVPLTIVRPSIMTASRHYPFPGWIDSSAGLGAFVMLAGAGHLRALACDPNARIDLVPVDEVSHRIAQACVSDTSALVIRHAVAGVDRSPTVAQCRDATERFFDVNRVDGKPDVRYLGPRGTRFTVSNFVNHKMPVALAALRSRSTKRRAEKRAARLAYLNDGFAAFTTRTFDFRTSQPLDAEFNPLEYLEIMCRGVYRHLFGRDESAWVLAGRARTARDADLRWALDRPQGNFWIRTAAWAVSKVLRRSVDAVTVDVPSFERALRGAPAGASLVLTPSHRSYLDFVLCTYLAFARPDLLPIPHIAATMEFARIPLLGRVLESMHAFYLRRGLGTPDPELAPRVEALLAQGKTLAFFVEGGRSRSGEFLPPKRGLLRCLQSTGRTCALLPIAISYERVPEHETFTRELAGHPKAKMRLGALLSWTVNAWRGRIDLGRVHIACGAPVVLDSSVDVHDVSHDVIRHLREAMVGDTNTQSPQVRSKRGETRPAPPSAKTGRRAGVKAAR